MGRYRQWLHYRELDQRLQDQLATLKTESSLLQEQATRLEAALPMSPITANPIVQALLLQQQIAAAATTSPEEAATQRPAQPEQPPQFGSLPNTPLPTATESTIPDYEYDSTYPPLPWWLRNVLRANGTLEDQQSTRTNKLVDRWITRWGKAAPSSDQQAVDDEEQRHHA
jgi:hypothetical protein